MTDKYGPDEFTPGEHVMSKRTGLQFDVVERDYDTLDGQQVYIVESTEIEDYVIPVLGGSIVRFES